MVSLITAVGANYLIGNNNKLPWNHPEDLKLFMRRTLGQVVVMGRRTWESIPDKPLMGRRNIVVSNTFETPPHGVWIYPNLEIAIFAGQTEGKEVYLIGGRQIYLEALEKNLVDRIYMSYIPGHYQGDIFFPKPLQGWCLSAFDPYQSFAVLTLQKINSSS